MRVIVLLLSSTFSPHGCNSWSESSDVQSDTTSYTFNSDKEPCQVLVVHVADDRDLKDTDFSIPTGWRVVDSDYGFYQGIPYMLITACGT